MNASSPLSTTMFNLLLRCLSLLSSGMSKALIVKSLVPSLVFLTYFISSQLTVLTSLIVLVLQYLGGYRFVYIVYKTAYRDLISLIRFKRAQFFLYRLKFRNQSVAKIFQQVCANHPNKILFYYANEKWTFEQIDNFSNQVANYFISQGFRKGDEVALFMDNRPEYVGIWLGLAKIGVVTALVNTNQRLSTLVHSITVVKCKALIFGSELLQAVSDIHTTMNKIDNFKFYCYDTFDRDDDYVGAHLDGSDGFNYKNLNNSIRAASFDPPQDHIDATGFNDCLIYIYTSGTEGLPKAAIVKNRRFVWMGAAVKFMVRLRKDDILYTSLPLYHLAGGTVGVCQSLIFGNTMAIRKKFSASNFWKDCVKYKCTIAQYIGEICRYLLSQPESPYDKTHSIRLMFGNGLRDNIWANFVDRFDIGQIAELYGSTEGNVNIINVDNKEGACGFISQIAPFVYPATLIRIDENTQLPVRDSNGLCVIAKPGEVGEFVGKINENDPTRAFDGYANKDATKRKIIENVFRKGDCAFASGDLLTIDILGYLYFKDRCGDTYRWKGENVSTMEVEAIISKNLRLADCIVYGVDVPGCEGKAGMAAILDKDRGIDLDELLYKLRQCLPVFMIPVFIRLVDFLEITATHKIPKTSYKKQGFNPQLIGDPMFMLDSKQSKYVKIDDLVYCNILNQAIKF